MSREEKETAKFEWIDKHTAELYLERNIEAAVGVAGSNRKVSPAQIRKWTDAHAVSTAPQPPEP